MKIFPNKMDAHKNIIDELISSNKRQISRTPDLYSTHHLTNKQLTVFVLQFSCGNRNSQISKLKGSEPKANPLTSVTLCISCSVSSKIDF